MTNEITSDLVCTIVEPNRHQSQNNMQ